MGPTLTIGHATANDELAHTSEVPQFGLGTFLMSEIGECEQSVLSALKLGYRHIDTAMAYENEHEVGQAIAEAIDEGIITRDELFVTTKLRRPHAIGFEAAKQRCQESLENLGLDYVDLYLVHAPPEDPEHRAPTWKGMESCLEEGWTKAIGVSNYGAHHLDKMHSYATLMPSVNQIEVHPWLQRNELRAATEAIGATVMAYSPLARGHKVGDPKLVEIAKKLGCTPAQAAIKWCLDAGCITVPKSSNPRRIEENLGSLEVNLAAQIEEIRALEENYISGWDPTVEA
ncbi:MAG: aldo/keto reductase [Candidatus Thalassarchaeaceae archaeon]|jgi:diketogulonate reductase-like aldo/keto reductase|nr:aldo/keto reductase [Candidatus Thalassarchaeaceae archaeon]MDP7043310.1 aldo/keto reductase [Candidatus Thalassarchaeaceae archaeon]